VGEDNVRIGGQIGGSERRSREQAASGAGQGHSEPRQESGKGGGPKFSCDGRRDRLH
jgi:hypothetical protein